MSPDAIRSSNKDTSSVVTNKVTGVGARPSGSVLLNFLFRVRDNYQAFDTRDIQYPFTWPFICSMDGGITYAPSGCRYNNSTATIHEVVVVIPAEWDNLIGFDTDIRIGRITAEGYVTKFGILNLACTAPDIDCFPIKLVSAYIGKFGGELSTEKVSDDNPTNTPERDIYFCGQTVCPEISPGAVPSGWIGLGN